MIRMNPLIEQFPKTVYVRNQEKAVYSDFRTILRCYEIAEKNTKGEYISPEGLIKMLSLFYEVPERMTEEHIDQMFWFMVSIRCFGLWRAAVKNRKSIFREKRPA